jgi:hypothetical protein
MNKKPIIVYSRRIAHRGGRALLERSIGYAVFVNLLFGGALYVKLLTGILRDGT